MKEVSKAFIDEAIELVIGCTECGMYTTEELDELTNLISTNPKKFVKKFKKLTGATNWDLSDTIFSYS